MVKEKTRTKQETDSNVYGVFEKIVIKTSPLTLPALVMAPPILYDIVKSGPNLDLYVCFLPQAVIAGIFGFTLDYLILKD